MGRGNTGRKKGTPNRKTSDMVARWDAIGFDPIDLATELIKKKSRNGLKDSEKVAACLKLAEFKYPKRRPIEAPKDPTKEDTQKTYVTEWGNRSEVSDAKEED